MLFAPALPRRPILLIVSGTTALLAVTLADCSRGGFKVGREETSDLGVGETNSNSKLVDSDPRSLSHSELFIQFESLAALASDSESGLLLVVSL